MIWSPHPSGKGHRLGLASASSRPFNRQVAADSLLCGRRDSRCGPRGVARLFALSETKAMRAAQRGRLARAPTPLGEETEQVIVNRAFYVKLHRLRRRRPDFYFTVLKRKGSSYYIIDVCM